MKDNTYDFELGGEDGQFPLITRLLKASAAATLKTSRQMRILEVNPADVARLNDEVQNPIFPVSALPWLTIVENVDIKVGHGRMSPGPTEGEE